MAPPIIMIYISEEEEKEENIRSRKCIEYNTPSHIECLYFDYIDICHLWRRDGTNYPRHSVQLELSYHAFDNRYQSVNSI